MNQKKNSTSWHSKRQDYKLNIDLPTFNIDFLKKSEIGNIWAQMRCIFQWDGVKNERKMIGKSLIIYRKRMKNLMV